MPGAANLVEQVIFRTDAQAAIKAGKHELGSLIGSSSGLRRNRYGGDRAIEDILTGGGGPVRPAEHWKPNQMTPAQMRTDGKRYSGNGSTLPEYVPPPATSANQSYQTGNVTQYGPVQPGSTPMYPRGPEKTSAMNAVKSTGSKFSAGRAAVTASSGPGLGGGAMALGAMGGGFAANMFSDPDQRGFGTFAKGAIAGGVGGAMLSKALDSKFLSQGARSWRHSEARASNNVINEAIKNTPNMSKEAIGTMRGEARAARADSWSAGATKMARGMESAQSRSMMFAGGAMLSGGLIGSGHSKAHGMNAQRGNRFGG